MEEARFSSLSTPFVLNTVNKAAVRVTFENSVIDSFITTTTYKGQAKNSKGFTTRKLNCPMFLDILGQFIQYDNNGDVESIRDVMWPNLDLSLSGEDVNREYNVHQRILPSTLDYTHTYSFAPFKTIIIFKGKQPASPNPEYTNRERFNAKSYISGKMVVFNYDKQLFDEYDEFVEIRDLDVY
jgi:hypothetical protein